MEKKLYKPLLLLKPDPEDLVNNVDKLMLVGNLAIQRIDYDQASRLTPDLKATGAMQFYSTIELVSVLAGIVEQVDIQCNKLGIQPEVWMENEGYVLKKAQDYCKLGRAELARQKLQNTQVL